MGRNVDRIDKTVGILGPYMGPFSVGGPDVRTPLGDRQMAKGYIVFLAYDADRYFRAVNFSADNAYDKLARQFKGRWIGSGMGFDSKFRHMGTRDLEYEFKTLQARDAFARHCRNRRRGLQLLRVSVAIADDAD
jgi:hypothetical protein